MNRARRKRLFVAIPLEARVREACARCAERLREAGVSARWVTPANYHVTVAFLGPVEAERVSELSAALRATVAKVAPFALPLDRVGGFPSTRRARVIWCGCGQPNVAFAQLCRDVQAALEPFDLHFEPHLDPHVTLARSTGTVLPQQTAAPARDAHAQSLVLFESFTQRDGARYVALESFPFGRRRAQPA